MNFYLLDIVNTSLKFIFLQVIFCSYQKTCEFKINQKNTNLQFKFLDIIITTRNNENLQIYFNVCNLEFSGYPTLFKHTCGHIISYQVYKSNVASSHSENNKYVGNCSRLTKLSEPLN